MSTIITIIQHYFGNDVHIRKKTLKRKLQKSLFRQERKSGKTKRSTKKLLTTKK